jgi:hypothetical protein
MNGIRGELVNIIIERCKKDKDAMPDHIIPYLREIIRYEMALRKLASDDYVNRIYLLAEQFSYIGHVSSYSDEKYQLVYNERVLVYNQKLLEPVKNKIAKAEIAIAGLRQQEAEWLGRSREWKNIHRAVEHKMNALKHKLKVELADGNASSYYAS